MTKLLTASTLAAVLSLAAAVDANAWSRSGSVTGWRGMASVSASGSCANGACNRQVTRTGPYGHSMSRRGSVACANGTCNGARTTTGPRGNTVTRTGSISD